MYRKLLFLMFSTFLIFIFLNVSLVIAENKNIENFESYTNTDSLSNIWWSFGYASMGIELVNDDAGAPAGNYMKYTYNTTTSTWGGVAEHDREDSTYYPLDLSNSKDGVQFYLKGDGSDQIIRLRLYQIYEGGEEARWLSHPISLTNTDWHIVRIPFILDTTEVYGFHLSYKTLGVDVEETEQDFLNALSHIVRFQVYLDHPAKNDTLDHEICVDEFRAVDFFPPTSPIQFCLEDYEVYPNTDVFKTAWQGFGYPTRDYVLHAADDSPEGYKNAKWVYNADATTTWGMAFRTRAGIITNLDLSSVKEGGVQFLMKGDGTANEFRFRFTDTENNYWASYIISIEDTTWHWVTVPFIVDLENGFRWCGNSPDSTYWGPIIGTEDELFLSLTKVNEIRFDIRSPEKDNITRSLELDAIYAVSELPPLPPELVDDFETYSDSDDLKLSWNQFGAGSTAMELAEEGAISGSKALAVSYNGSLGYTAVRKRNILPPHNFSKLQAGIQYWLKGDGSNNMITFRLQNGNEMWESADIPLNDTDWQHRGIKFAADSVLGFRYLGNNPDNPIWSTDVGTTEQLYGDLASIDQVRFYVRGPESVDQVYSFMIDKLEGVDVFENDTKITAIENELTDNLPAQFDLKQNFPNPFNPATTIVYSLNKAGIVSLNVYNVLGQKVKVLVNEHQQGGLYNVKFNASNFASGLYFYRLQIKSTNGVIKYNQVKRMLLIK